MNVTRTLRPAAAALAAVLLTASACAPLDEVLLPTGAGSARSGIVQGEVRSMDARRGRLQVREDYGRTLDLRVDRRTQVTGARRNSVDAIQRGDLVRVRVTHDRNGTLWADRVEVRDSYRGSPGGVAGRVERLSGRVGAVDTRRGYFTIEQSRDRVVVHVPRRLSNNDARRFERLRRGDRVNVEVRAFGRNEVELIRFR